MGITLVNPPYPGTRVYNKVVEEGILKITDFSKFDTATPFFEMGTNTGDELRDIREKAFQRFYFRPAYFFSIFGTGKLLSFAILKTILAHLRRAVKRKLGIK